MTGSLRRSGALLCACAMVLAIGALSRVPYEADGSAEALIRLAWRARGTRVEDCRTPTLEELHALPVHMRRDRICEGRVLPYRLEVRIDERPVLDQLVRAHGARADRPLYVYAELPVAPGRHSVNVRFVRQNGDDVGDVDEHTPAELSLDAELVLARKDIALVTYDAEARALVLRGRGRETER